MTEYEIRQKVVNTAVKHYGKKESNGSFKGIIDTYNKHKPLARGYAVRYTDEWCATFVSAIAIQCGYTKIMPTECSCYYMIQAYKKLGRWEEKDSYVPKPGDIIMYDWEDSGRGDNTGTPNHVGIVHSVTGNAIKIIEGNINASVGYRTVLTDGKHIRGYCLPDYAGIASSDNKDVENKATSTKKTVEEIAKEVIKGKWGNNPERAKKLKAAGYDPAAVQKIVNKLLS